MRTGGQLIKKENCKLLIGGIRIFVLITYLLYILGMPSLAVHAGAAAQEGDTQPEGDRPVNYNYYLPLIMNGLGLPPEDILLSNDTIDENMPVNSIVGIFSTVDPNADDIFTYSLVAGEGDADNGSFNILNDQLRSSEIFNYEQKNAYSIRVQTKDVSGSIYQEIFVIEILDVDDLPVADDQTVSTKQDEDVSITLSGTDEDADPLTFLLVTLPDHGILYEDGDPLKIVTLPQTGGAARVSAELVYSPNEGFSGGDGFTFQVLANEQLSNTATVTINVDGTGPILYITGATADGDPMAGELGSGFILGTTKDPSIEAEHLIQLADGSNTDELLADEYFGLTLVAAETTVSAADLITYYENRGLPSEYLTYLTGAANGTNPFVFIKGHPDLSVTLVDGAKHVVGENDADMTVPDDFPLGTYTVRGQVEDVFGNPTTVTFKLIVEIDEVSLLGASMESTDEYEIYQGVVYKKYQMMYMSTQISLADTNLRSLWVKEPGGTDYISLALDDDPLLWFDVENPGGTYEYIAVTLAGDAYSASLIWPEQQTASFEPTGNIGEDNGLFYQEYKLMDGETEISFAGEDVEIFAQKVGSNWISMSGPNLGDTLWVSLDKPVGIYEYLLVTQDDVVYLVDLVIEDDVTDPTLDGVTPLEGAVVLGVGENFVLTVDGNDRQLFELEVDHSLEGLLPEFSVYAYDEDPYGGQYEQFEALGVVVTYVASEQTWTIDFGPAITSQFVANGGITFYLVLKDYVGNAWGSMSPPTGDNTFIYTITQEGV